jgi:hypothetical protein
MAILTMYRLMWAARAGVTRHEAQKLLSAPSTVAVVVWSSSCLGCSPGKWETTTYRQRTLATTEGVLKNAF